MKKFGKYLWQVYPKNMVSHMPDVWQRSRRPKSLFLPLDIGPNSTSENLWNSRLSLGMGMPSLNCCRRHCPVPQTEQVLPLQEETASEPSSASSPVDTPPQKPPEVETAQMNVTPPETIEKFGQAYNVYHRETLYQEVWAMPVTEVAKRYKVSDAAIHKVCKSLDIPTPPQGYWAKLRAGKPVKKLPLPPHLWNFCLKKSGKWC